MAIAHVSSALATPVYSGSSITAAVTRGAANYIVCFPMGRDNTLASNGATYDGNAMTQLYAPTTDGGVHLAAYGFALTTDANLVASFNGTVNNVAQMAYALFSGVDTASPLIDANVAGENSTDVDIPALTTGDANAMGVGACFLRTNSAITGETGTDIRASSTEATFGSAIAIGTAAGAASVSMGFNLGAAAEAFGVGVLLRAAGGGAVGRGRLVLGKLVGGNLLVRAR